jgi:hypothetical protein
LNEQDNQCYDKKQVNETSQCIAADNSEQPEDEQDNKDCPEQSYTSQAPGASYTTEAWTQEQ